MKDIIVIGGGPGGYVAAIRAAQLGAKVCLIEKESLGGTCLNRGCIPTKTIYRTAELLNNLSHIEDFGISVSNPEIDVNKIQERKRNIIKTLVTGIETLLKGNNIEFIKGEASLVDKNTVVVSTKDEEMTIEAKSIIIATGSKSEIPLIEGVNNKKIITSTELLDFDHIPKSLVIIGGGVIGMEFASIFNAMGSKVTVIVARDSILYDIDKDISKRYVVMSKKAGIEILTNTKVMSFSGEEEVIIKCQGKKGEFEVKGEQVLLAKGRNPNYEGINVEKLGIEIYKKGIKVDENYETSLKGVYAIGDVNGISLLAHAASHQGVVTAEGIILNKTCHKSVIPYCIFTFPEIAVVGITEEEAKNSGLSYKKNKFLFGANGKALALGEGEGLVKVISDENNKILGVHILGPHASDLILEGTIMVEKGMRVSDLKEVVHSHPTLGEALHEAVLGLNKEAIHSINK
ncbi:dihydrolipoyl dehydrogenase [Clostridium tagluense]|uniref:dihydrolipoyl dehydrogenase n=1 Tax=Clostridium tagluense TaxID=360422 RepID=UPI001CF2D984|nr:dihydrolipoyl dehydrogenase [Clostridium tagluense]MCB2298367.1 dihydrolipoyl dehydrogenase [Clostridium tagluense]